MQPGRHGLPAPAGLVAAAASPDAFVGWSLGLVPWLVGPRP
ncbi:hypothetical protein [Actinomyces wuliandei]|nr:hypothetical protein [Actinomyces wuliandei]